MMSVCPRRKEKTLIQKTKTLQVLSIAAKVRLLWLQALLYSSSEDSKHRLYKRILKP